ncbi:MAG: hypothetical protein HYT19_00565 [Candidatus Nealsonbacteria bacterium]|nr:hypothetical protein [Candidatus Nealsonbacteria bacterium]
MKVSPKLTAEEKKLLEHQGVVFPEGDDPHFDQRMAPAPAGRIRLSSGKTIPHTPIAQLGW